MSLSACLGSKATVLFVISIQFCFLLVHRTHGFSLPQLTVRRRARLSIFHSECDRSADFSRAFTLDDSLSLQRAALQRGFVKLRDAVVHGHSNETHCALRATDSMYRSLIFRLSPRPACPSLPFALSLLSIPRNTISLARERA